jgi:hypothetical protein
MEKKIGESLGISGFTLSIMGVLFLGLNGILISIISFIFCFIQQKKNPNKFGKAGLILSVIGFILNVIVIVISVLYLAPLLNQMGGI